MKMTGVEELLYAQFEPMCLERFGVLLLGSVYAELSAYVVVDSEGRVAAFKLIDAAFHTEELIRSLSVKGYEEARDGTHYNSGTRDRDEHAAYMNGNVSDGMRTVLFCNHPTGDMSPTEDDLRVMELLSVSDMYVVYEDECVAVGNNVQR